MLLLKDLPSLDITNINTSNLTIHYQSRIMGYTSYVLPKDIFKKISSLFKEELLLYIEGIYLQTITPGFNNYIHRDPRSYAINYLLELGGDDVKTCFYSNGIEDSYVVPLNTWHIFRADRDHCVKNIDTIRKAITISFKKEVEITTILKLIKME